MAASTMPRSSANPLAVYRIVLRDNKRYDSIEKREFDLPISSIVPIGRASKSVAKQELIAAPHNAYIDSPVMSREHAILSAVLKDGNPEVFITDTASMHGTMLNGRKLLPNTPELLHSGALLQFGVNINRNEEFFLAREYTFESHLASRFSLGFTVPDAESEDEHVECHEPQGSQWNPLSVEDSDAGSTADRPADNQDVTIDEAPNSTPSAGIEVDTLSAHGSLHVEYDATSIDHADEMDVASIDFTDETDSVASTRNDAVGTGNPEMYKLFKIHMNSVDCNDNDEGAEDEDSTYSIMPSRGSVLDVEESMTEAEAPEAPNPMTQSRNAITSDNDLLKISDTNVYQDTFVSNYNCTENVAPTLPPQPLFPSAMPSSGVEFVRFGRPDWPVCTHPQGYNTRSTGFDSRSPLFSAPISSPVAQSKEHDLFTDVSDTPQKAYEMQTPPPMPVSDVVTPAPQPIRRTKVSIEEIVEDQPPSPKSPVLMKRKADVLDEEVINAMLEPATMVSDSAVATARVADGAAVQVLETATLVAQRPKRQPRSVLAKAAKTAKYFGVGTAGALAAFTALAVLPDTFFM